MIMLDFIMAIISKAVYSKVSYNFVLHKALR